MSDHFGTLCIKGFKGRSSIFRWTENEDFQYGISRFWEKYGRETVFSTLHGAGNYWKKHEKSGFGIIKNGILIFEHPLKKSFAFKT